MEQPTGTGGEWRELRGTGGPKQRSRAVAQARRQQAPRRLWRRSVICASVSAAALLLAIVALVAGCGGANDETGPSGDLRTPTSLSAGNLPAGAQAVSFDTSDGVTLSGALFGGGDRGVVLLHMYPADQTSWFAIAERLAGDGYQVLTFDFRGYGASGGDKDIGLIDRDAEAAVREIERQGASAVALVGASMGGTAALIAADRAPVAGVATLSAPVEFKGLSAAEAVGRVTAPKLFLGTERDSGGEAARQLYESAADPREVEVYPGDEHGTGMLTGAEGAAVVERLDAWLADVLAGSEGGGG